jgi:H+/Cl- antiporter ClcA
MVFPVGHGSGVVAPSLMLGGIFGRLVAALLPLWCIDFLAPDGDFGQYIARCRLTSTMVATGGHQLGIHRKTIGKP